MTETVLAGRRAIGFAPSRKAAELIYTYTRRRLQDRDRRAPTASCRTAPATPLSSAAR